MESFLNNRHAIPGRNPSTQSATVDFQPFQSHAAAPAPEPIPAHPQLTAPQVDVVNENGRIAKIVVTCRCCERIELACEY